MAEYERLSLEGRIWEREMLRKFGLLDVEWKASECCDSCRVPARKRKASAGATEEVEDQMEPVPPSGTRERWSTKGPAEPTEPMEPMQAKATKALKEPKERKRRKRS